MMQTESLLVSWVGQNVKISPELFLNRGGLETVLGVSGGL